MILEEIYYISQIVAVFAILASLVFVGLQLRQNSEQMKLNTRTIKASASFDARQAWADALLEDSQRPDEVIGLFLSAMDHDKGWDDFTPIERTRMAIHFRHLILRLEGQFHLFKYGILDKELWEARRDYMSRTIALPFFNACWEAEKTQRVVSASFIEMMDAAADATGPTPWTGFADANAASADAAPVGEEAE